MASEAEPDRLDSLTQREREVLELLRLGLTDAEIAARLDISRRGASKHVGEIIGKLGVRNRYEAASWPDPPPWWAGALAPGAFLWRRGSALAPAKVSGLAAGVSAGALLALLGGLALVAALLLAVGGETGAEDVGSMERVESDAGGAGPLSPGPLPTPTPNAPSPADGEQAAVAVVQPVPAAGAMAVDCSTDAPGIQSECAYDEGDLFTVHVHVVEPPSDGYFGFQAKVRWDGAVLDYRPSPAAGDEALWPECDVPARHDNRPGDPSVLFGCAPFPALSTGSTATGAVLQFTFVCGGGGASSLSLVPAPADQQLGAHFLDALLRPLDPALLGARVTCGTPAPAPTATPTPEWPTPGDDCPEPKTGEELLFASSGWGTLSQSATVVDAVCPRATDVWTFSNVLPMEAASGIEFADSGVGVKVLGEGEPLSVELTLPSGNRVSIAADAEFRLPPGEDVGIYRVAITGVGEDASRYRLMVCRTLPGTSSCRFSEEVTTPDIVQPSPGAGGGMAVYCSGPLAGTEGPACTMPSGSRFEAMIMVARAPEGGYTGFAIELTWDNETLDWAPISPEAEVSSDGCEQRTRIDEQPASPTILFRCAAKPPPPEGRITGGFVLLFGFRCERDGTGTIRLVPRGGGASRGTYFVDGGGRTVDPYLHEATVTCE